MGLVYEPDPMYVVSPGLAWPGMLLDGSGVWTRSHVCHQSRTGFATSALVVWVWPFLDLDLTLFSFEMTLVRVLFLVALF